MSPTAQVVATVGAAIVTRGSVPTVMRRAAVPLAPPGLVTRRRTLT